MPTAIPLQPVSAYEFITPVVAHRGASGQAPENTAAAIRLAAAQGARLLQFLIISVFVGLTLLRHMVGNVGSGL